MNIGDKMSGIIGKKLGMSNVFGKDGEIIPVTVIQAGPCKIVNIRTKKKMVMKLYNFRLVKEKKNILQNHWQVKF